MDEFYDGWQDDWERGYNMTSEEWDEFHAPYSEKYDPHPEEE